MDNPYLNEQTLETQEPQGSEKMNDLEVSKKKLEEKYQIVFEQLLGKGNFGEGFFFFILKNILFSLKFSFSKLFSVES